MLMRPFSIVSLILCGVVTLAAPIASVQAQEQQIQPVIGPIVPEDNGLQAVITGPSDIAVGRTIVLDASFSRIAGENVQYEWFVGDNRQPISKTVEAVYTPEKPGKIIFRLFLSSTVGGTRVSSETTHTVSIYQRKIVLIADASVQSEKLMQHQQSVTATGVFLLTMQAAQATTPLGSEEALVSLLHEQSASLAGANALVLWTEGVTGLQALLNAFQENDELLAAMRNQSIVLISDGSLQTLARTARGPFGVLHPQRIILTRKEAIDVLVNAPSNQDFFSELEKRDLEHVTIDESTAGLRPWNVLSSLVNSMLTSGVPSQTVILLLVLPVIATILAFFKQVIGITTFGLYTPSIIALSFLALGWRSGVFFLFFIVITGYAVRSLMRSWRLLYIPKVAIVLAVVSFTLLLLMAGSAYLGRTFTRETIFILLIMSTLSESFLSLKTEQGWYSAIMGIAETVGAALVCVFLVQSNIFQTLILAYPELVLFTIPLNVLLGRFTGLRFMEYLRFREVFKHLQEE
jgi:hypothetical protein